MTEPTHPSILAHFSSLEDPRLPAKVLYPLMEILLLALAAAIAWHRRDASAKRALTQRPPNSSLVNRHTA